MAAEMKNRGLCLIVTTSEQQPKDQIQDNKKSWICNTLATSNNMQGTNNSKSFGRCSFDGRWKTNRAPGMQLFWQGIHFDVTVVVKLHLKRCQYSQCRQIENNVGPTSSPIQQCELSLYIFIVHFSSFKYKEFEASIISNKNRMMEMGFCILCGWNL